MHALDVLLFLGASSIIVFTLLFAAGSLIGLAGICAEALKAAGGKREAQPAAGIGVAPAYATA